MSKRDYKKIWIVKISGLKVYKLVGKLGKVNIVIKKWNEEKIIEDPMNENKLRYCDKIFK